MNRHAELLGHLPLDDIEKCYRTCKDGRVKSRWHAIWLRMRGKTTTEVSEIISCQPDWVRRLVRRWNSGGPESLKDGRESNGRDPLLSPSQQADLLQALMQPAPDGGLWNGPKVAQWISQRVGHSVPAKRGWIYMRDLGFTSQTPRPRHREADRMKQEEFKKNSPNYLPILAVFAQRQKLRSGHKMKRA